MEDLEDINKIIELDIASEIKPQPEELAEIFEAVVVEDKIEEEILRKYFYKTEPTLEDISEGLQMVAENQRNNIPADSYTAISEGIKVLSSKEKPVLPEEELHKIYDRLTSLLENTPQEKAGFGKLILSSLLIVGGSVIATIALPHIVEKKGEYADQIEELLSWINEAITNEEN